MGKFADRLKGLRAEREMTQEALAKAVGATQQSIDQAEKGQTLNPKWLLRAARFFGVRPEWLKGDDDGPREALAPPMSLTSVPVRAHVQAGEWRMIFEWDRDEWYGFTPPADRRFPRAERLALEVRGDSMNLLYPAGSILVVVRYIDIGKRPTAGERVVCLRHNATGQVEATVKELQSERGVLSLVARSDHPRRYPPIRIDGGKTAPLKLRESGDEIELYARVIGAYRAE